MDLQEARQLRKELEAIEAAMKRIKSLWQELPTADDLDALGQTVTDIACSMESISTEWQSTAFPTADAISPAIVKVKEMPTSDGLDA